MDKIFKALADRNRRKILTLLRDKEFSVGDLLVNFEIGQATLSSHLAILKKAGLVNCRVVGKQRIYRLSIETLADFAQNLRKFVGIIEETEMQDIAIRPARV